jgi:signal peptidase
MEKKWYQKVSNWLFGIVVVILLSILAINIHITIQAKNNENVVPSVFGYRPFFVLSGSMEKEIHKGDLIITKIIEPSTLKINDVIAFRDEENTVTTHRIIDMIERDGNTYFVTKGDNNNTQDQNLVEYKDVEGIYVGRVPLVGTILNELAKPVNAVILVMGITIIFILLFQRSSRKIKLEEQAEFLAYKREKELALKNMEKIQKEINEAATTPKKATKTTTTKKGGSKKSTVKAAPKKSATKTSTTKKVATKSTKTNATRKVATKKNPAKQTSRKHS